MIAQDNSYFCLLVILPLLKASDGKMDSLKGAISLVHSHNASSYLTPERSPFYPSPDDFANRPWRIRMMGVLGANYPPLPN